MTSENGSRGSPDPVPGRGGARRVRRAGRPLSIVEPGDPTATAENIRSSATLFRLGFVADLVQATLFLFTAMALYLLLRHVNELVARAMVVLVAISVAIISLNLLNQYMALSIATGAGSRVPWDRTG